MNSSDSESLFKGRKLRIVTKHKKENVLAPLFDNYLQVSCVTVDGIDTDQLGTFSGEIERPGTPVETLRNKCLLGIDENASDLILASEGSFGPHYANPFISANEEWLMFMDVKNGIEIIEKVVSMNTNYSATIVSTRAELLEFAEKALFPSHGLILKKSESDHSETTKGIVDLETLEKRFISYMEKYGKAYVETDMRAMYNPTRMKVIESAAIKLIEKIKNNCPNCAYPGFQITQIFEGLPCSVCFNPTSSPILYRYKCVKCDWVLDQRFPLKRELENPMFCNYCNP